MDFVVKPEIQIQIQFKARATLIEFFTFLRYKNLWAVWQIVIERA